MEDLTKRASQIAKNLKDQPPFIAEYSTEAGLYSKDNDSPICNYTNNQDLLFTPIYNELKSNPSLTQNDFFFVSNRVSELIIESRRYLLEKVLSSEGNPILSDKEKIINNMGEALDIQLGRDKSLIDSDTPAIINKLKKLGVDECLFDKYNQLHPYFLTTKHSDKSKFFDALRLLGQIEGKQITLEYFEVVRRIIKGYCESKDYKLPQELEEIDYSKYGFNI